MPQPKATKTSRLTPRQVLLAAGVVVLSGLVYLPTLGYDFVLDDKPLIAENRDMLAPTPFGFFVQSYVRWEGMQGEDLHAYYRPLVASSFWLDLRLWGMRSSGFHLTNVLLNCVVGALVVLVLAELLASFWPVLLGGLAFALHPAHVESVANVAGRTDLLMALFLVFAFLALLHFRQRPSGTWFALALVSFTAAMLCKETAILFPALTAFVLLPELRKPAKRSRALLMVGALAAVGVAYLVARAAVLAGPALGWGEVGPGQRLMLAVNSFGRYAFMSLFPFDRRIYQNDAAALAAFGWPTLAAAAALAAAVWAAIRYRSTPVGIGSLWFVLAILPGCNLFPPGRSFLSQRMLYLPTVGVVLTFAALAMTLRRGRQALAVCVALYAGVMGLVAIRSMPAWRSQLSLDTTIVAECPNDVKARFELGRDLLAAGDREGAAREFYRSLASVLGDTAAWLSLGDVMAHEGDMGGAVAAYRQALSILPNSALLHSNLGAALGQIGDTSGAEREYRRAIELQPDLAAAHNNLGQLLAVRGSQDSAIVEFRLALQSQPDNTGARFNLGVALQASGRLEEARAAFERVLLQDPGYPGASERLRALPRAVLRQ
ncbi:tetratricopeptide repeat protein [candidate division WOR-3 bacterium]|nr:tetratricopeptide repeat protein [candidate division WOR-3 bacterium]